MEEVKESSTEREIRILISENYYSNREEFLNDAFRALLRSKPRLKLALAAELYKNKEVTLSKAAEIAGLSVEGMKEYLVERGIELKRSSPKNLKEASKLI